MRLHACKSVLCVWTMVFKVILQSQHNTCEHACIYAIGVQTVKVNSMLAPNNLIVEKYAPKKANKNNCCDVLNIYRYACPYYLSMPLFILFIYFGLAAARPAGPVPTPMEEGEDEAAEMEEENELDDVRSQPLTTALWSLPNCWSPFLRVVRTSFTSPSPSLSLVRRMMSFS